MAQKKPYNSNTKYGRKKLRQQSQKYYESLPPDEQSDFKLTGVVITLVIVIIVLGIGYCTGNTKGALKWLTH